MSDVLSWNFGTWVAQRFGHRRLLMLAAQELRQRARLTPLAMPTGMPMAAPVATPVAVPPVAPVVRHIGSSGPQLRVGLGGEGVLRFVFDGVIAHSLGRLRPFTNSGRVMQTSNSFVSNCFFLLAFSFSTVLLPLASCCSGIFFGCASWLIAVGQDQWLRRPEHSSGQGSSAKSPRAQGWFWKLQIIFGEQSFFQMPIRTIASGANVCDLRCPSLFGLIPRGLRVLEPHK